MTSFTRALRKPLIVVAGLARRRRIAQRDGQARRHMDENVPDIIGPSGLQDQDAVSSLLEALEQTGKPLVVVLVNSKPLVLPLAARRRYEALLQQDKQGDPFEWESVYLYRQLRSEAIRLLLGGELHPVHARGPSCGTEVAEPMASYRCCGAAARRALDRIRPSASR